jgi:hypothetical protein
MHPSNLVVWRCKFGVTLSEPHNMLREPMRGSNPARGVPLRSSHLIRGGGGGHNPLVSSTLGLVIGRHRHGAYSMLGVSFYQSLLPHEVPRVGVKHGSRNHPTLNVGYIIQNKVVARGSIPHYDLSRTGRKED